MRSEREARRLIFWAVAALLAGGVALWVLFLVRGVLLVLYISVLLAIGFSPAVRWLQRFRFGTGRFGLPRWAALLIFYVTVLGLIAAIIAIVLRPLTTQSRELWQALPGYADKLQTLAEGSGLLTPGWTWKELLGQLPSPSLAVTGLLGAVQGAIGAVGAVVTILVLPYYLLLEAEDLHRGLLTLVEPGQRPVVARVTRDVAAKVGAWLGGQMVLAFVIGATATIGLWILGVPYFYVLGLVAGIGEFVPVIGPIVAAIPAVLMGWTVSLKVALLVAGYFAVQQSVENHFLVPRIMQRQVGLSAVMVIAALLIGSELLGVVGALLAVPTAAIVQVLVQEFLERDDT
jgi:predicted PurR-regulated permease PerM